MENDQKTVEKNPVIREDLVEAFNKMWGKAPWPVMLIHKSHTIIAQNPLCIKLVKGSFCGQKCVNAFSGDHSGCRAQEAIKQQLATTSSFERMGLKGCSYWIPVAGEPEYLLHFAISEGKMPEDISMENTCLTNTNS